MITALCLFLTAALAAADQLFKFFARSALEGGPAREVFRGVLSLEYVQNSGAAFGSFKGGATVLGIVTALMIAVMLLMIILKKVKGRYLAALVMICAGGIGNVIDRFRLGYVIDYLRADFIEFPVFNFADILVTCGCIMLMVFVIIDIAHEKNKKNTEKNEL